MNVRLELDGASTSGGIATHNSMLDDDDDTDDDEEDDNRLLAVTNFDDKHIKCSQE